MARRASAGRCFGAATTAAVVTGLAGAKACSHGLLAFVPSILPGGPGVQQQQLRTSSARRQAAVDPATSGRTGHVAILCAGAVAAASAALRGARAQRRCKDEAEPEDVEWKGAEGFSGLTGSVPLVLDNVAVAKVLPHRYPFLLVDKVIEYEPGKRAVGVKNVSANEPQFTGHFPDQPIMPGVLMVEAMAQLGGIIALQPPVSDGKGQFFFAGIDGIKFRKPVVPGDTLVMEMELRKFREKYGIAKMRGKAYVDGKLAVEVKEFTFALVKEKKETEG